MTEKRIFRLVLVTAVFVLSVSCSKNSERNTSVYRLLDHLGESNILRSPLKAAWTDKKAMVEKELSNGFYPLQDSGIGENPYNVKLKLRAEGVEMNVIFAPPESEYRYPIKLDREATLDFGIGILKNENPEDTDSNGKQDVNFFIVLEANGRKKTIFQKYVSFSSSEEAKRLSFSRHKIDLPIVRSQVLLSLITKGDKNTYSFWYNPVLRRPDKKGYNVILISIDTLRADHVGCYGYSRETTPNIDSLASDSAVFLNTYASSSWTLPSHVSLLTSLNTVRHGVNYHDQRMSPSLVTLADLLRQNGFSNSAFTGGGFVSATYGFSKGFDMYREGEGGVFNQNGAELVYRVVSRWLDQSSDNQFFLFIHTYQPHSPYACPYPYKVMFLEDDAKWGHLDITSYIGGKKGLYKKLSPKEQRDIIGLYDGEIRFTDEELIKPLLLKLKELGIYERTMIVLTSDHGEEFFDHGSWTHGQNLYDESLRVPLIIKFPGSKYRGKKIGSIVRLIDVMPTILDELGIDYSGISVDGLSLIPFLKGRESKDRIFLAEIGDNVLNSHVPWKKTMNFEKFKLILNKEYSKEDLKFFSPSPSLIPKVELYDLVKDPRELENIASKMPALARQLTRKIKEAFSKARIGKQEKIKLSKELRDQLKALGYIR